MRLKTKIHLLAMAGLLIAFMPGERSRSEYNTPVCASAVGVGDIDYDGDNDIVVGHNFNFQANWSGISILANNENINFTLTDSLYFYGWQTYIQIANLDTIITPEILFRKETPTKGFIGIIFNNNYNDSIFLISSFSAANNVVIGDIDDNGFNDIIYCLEQEQRWGIFYNDGNRNFSKQVHSSSTYINNIACGDLNNDGRADIVTSGSNIVIYFSEPGNFQKIVLDSVNFTTSVLISDFDNDGYQDILSIYGNYFFNCCVLFKYKNNGDETFEALPSILYPGVYSFFIADFNNDDLPDILFQRGDCSGDNIYYNQGNFQLADSQFVYIPGYGESDRRTYCADMDGNSCTDIITIRATCQVLPANVDILYNDGNGNFLPDPMVGYSDKKDASNITLVTYPNPFQYRTKFEFNMPHPGFVDLSIYDFQGNLIERLIYKRLKKGKYNIEWDIEYRWIYTDYFIANLRVDGKSQKSIKILSY
jgi:hypothetical protein